MIRGQKSRKSTHFKTRTGCVTCKARRIKCDEGRPDCRKCKATGRHCDYQFTDEIGDDAFDIVAFQHFRSNGALRRLDNFNNFSNGEELRFLGFFLYQTAYVLDGFTQPDLWTRTILQMSYCEPAIRHLMLSLASLHESYMLGDAEHTICDTTLGSLTLQRNYVFALQHQNKAISLVRERIASGKPPLAYILAACALFMCIEMLRGETNSAMQHLKSGVQLILARYANRESNLSTAITGQIRGLEKGPSTEKRFIVLFAKLAVIQTLYGLFISKRDQSLAIHIEDENSDQPFDNEDDIVEATSNLMSRVMVLENAIATSPCIDADAIRKEQLQLGEKLELIKSNFEQYIVKQEINQGTVTNQQARRWSLLRMYYILANIWIESGLNPSEMIYDKYIMNFQMMMELAEEVLGQAGQFSKRKQPFSLDLGILSTLYITSIKCRDPKVRRKAIDLLYLAPRLEGQGDAYLLAKIAQKIIRVEERGFHATIDLPFPPESSRVYDFALDEADAISGEKLTLSMVTKPGGMSSDIVLLREEVDN